jgi:hypothetical protein
VGDKLIDATVDSRLRRMRDQLSEHGGAAVRERFDQIIEDKP